MDKPELYNSWLAEGLNCLWEVDVEDAEPDWEKIDYYIPLDELFINIEVHYKIGQKLIYFIILK